MYISVTNIIEEEDGSATIGLNIDEEALNILVEHAIIDILTRYMTEANAGGCNQDT
jgi:hypothetical protein